MAAFSINGREADTLAEAIDLCREIWAAHKAPAVLEQTKDALAKVTPLDLKRAELGVVPNLSGAAKGD